MPKPDLALDNSLQKTRLEPGNGRAFQFCNCTGQPCALSPASLDSAVLVCDSGFVAQARHLVCCWRLSTGPAIAR